MLSYKRSVRRSAPVKIVEAPVRAYVPTSLPPGSIAGEQRYYYLEVELTLKWALHIHRLYCTTYVYYNILLLPSSKVVPALAEEVASGTTGRSPPSRWTPPATGASPTSESRDSSSLHFHIIAVKTITTTYKPSPLLLLRYMCSLLV